MAKRSDKNKVYPILMLTSLTLDEGGDIIADIGKLIEDMIGSVGTVIRGFTEGIETAKPLHSTISAAGAAVEDVAHGAGSMLTSIIRSGEHIAAGVAVGSEEFGAIGKSVGKVVGETGIGIGSAIESFINTISVAIGGTAAGFGMGVLPTIEAMPSPYEKTAPYKGGYEKGQEFGSSILDMIKEAFAEAQAVPPAKPAPTVPKAKYTPPAKPELPYTPVMPKYTPGPKPSPMPYKPVMPKYTPGPKPSPMPYKPVMPKYTPAKLELSKGYLSYTPAQIHAVMHSKLMSLMPEERAGFVKGYEDMLKGFVTPIEDIPETPPEEMLTLSTEEMRRSYIVFPEDRIGMTMSEMKSKAEKARKAKGREENIEEIKRLSAKLGLSAGKAVHSMLPSMA